MAKDFRADRTRVGTLIGSASHAAGGTLRPGIMVYSSSVASNFAGAVTDSAMLDAVGTDVFFFVSGSATEPHTENKPVEGGVALFGGDLHVSGTLRANHIVGTLDPTVTGSLYLSGSLFVGKGATINIWEGLDSSHDFKVSGKEVDHLIFADASSQNVVIGGSHQIHPSAGASENVPLGILEVGSGSGNNSNIVINKASAGSGSLTFRSNGIKGASITLSTAEHLIFGFTNESIVSNKDIIFNVNKGVIQTEVMRFDGSESSVGIGGASSLITGSMLQIRETDADNKSALRIYHSDTAANKPAVYIQVHDATNPGGTSSPALKVVQFGTGDILNLLDGTTEVVTVLDGGNVGIGVIDPDETLEVAGDVKISGANKLYLYDTGGEHLSSDGTDLTAAAGGAINLTATTDVVIPANVGVTFGSGEKIEGNNTDLTVTSGGAINLTATTDVVVPADVGITFGSGEKIEGNNTDLTVTSGGAINLTATTDVVLPANVGVTFGSGEKIEGNNTNLTITSGADINLNATDDVNLPASVGLTFGNDGEKIEGDGTDLTIAGNNINLTAVADVNIPSGVGLTFATTEKIESDGTDLTITVGAGGDINIPANIGVTFGNDGEKIEGDGTDLTIASSNDLNLTATAAVVVPSGVPLEFGADSGEKIAGNGTNLQLNSGADINLTATDDVNLPVNVGLTFGDDGEKIEGDGTDLTIQGNNINLSPTEDVVIPVNKGLIFGDGTEKIESDNTDLTISAGVDINLTPAGGADVNLPSNIGLTFGNDGEKIEGDGTKLVIASSEDIDLNANTNVNVPSGVGLTFGNDGEKIEGDGTDLTIGASNDLNLTAVADVVITNQTTKLEWGGAGSGEHIVGAGSNELTIAAGADINLTATDDVNLPVNVGLTFGNDGEKIEGNGTGLTVAGGAVTLDSENSVILDAGGSNILLADDGTNFGRLKQSSSNFVIKPEVTDADIIFLEDGGTEIFRLNSSAESLLMASSKKIQFGDAAEYISGDGTDLTIASSKDLNLTATAAVVVPSGIPLEFVADSGESISGDGTDLTIAAGAAINLNAGTLDLSNQTVDVTLNAAVDALNFDSDTLSIDASNNRVGIGTAAPGAKLEIEVADSEDISGVLIDFNETGAYKALEIDSEAGAVAIYAHGKYGARFEQDLADGYGLYISRNMAEAGSEPLTSIIDDNTTNTQTTLMVQQDGTGNIVTFHDAGAEVFTVADGGHVGIKNTYPVAQLVVGDGSGARSIHVDAGGSSSGSLAFSKGGGDPGATISFDSSENLVLSTVNTPGLNKDILFKVNDGGVDTEVMRVDGSHSSVAIGVNSNTVSKLKVHVTDGDNVDGIEIVNADAGQKAIDIDSEGTGIEINAKEGLTVSNDIASGYGAIFSRNLEADDTSNPLVKIRDQDGDQAALKVIQESTDTSAFAIQIANASAIKTTMSGSGQVGIGVGTSTYDAMLHVKGITRGDGIVLEDASSADTVIKIYESIDDGVIDIYRNNSVVNRFHGNADSYITGGDLGLGVTTPEAELEISNIGSTTDATLLISTHQNRSGSIAFRKGATGTTKAALVFTEGETLDLVNSGSNKNIVFKTTGTGKIISSGSFIGIAGLSGSLTHLSDGSPYLRAGNNITIDSGSAGNSYVTITGAPGGDVAAQYLVLSATGSLDNERVFTAGTGISVSDGGAGGAYTVSVNASDLASTFATITGSIFTGKVGIVTGSYGSITPAAQLEVQSAESGLPSGILITSHTSNSGSLMFRQSPTGATRAALVYDNDESLVLVNSSSGDDIILKYKQGSTLKEFKIVALTNDLILDTGLEIYFKDTDGASIASSNANGQNIKIDAPDTSSASMELASAGSMKLQARNPASTTSGAVNIIAGDKTQIKATDNTGTIRTGHLVVQGGVAVQEVVINEDSHDYIDFRVETDGSDKAIYVDADGGLAGTGEVHIGGSGGAGWNGDFNVHSTSRSRTLFVDGQASRVGILLQDGTTSRPQAELQIGAGLDNLPMTVLINVDGDSSGSYAISQESGGTKAAFTLDKDDSVNLVNSGSSSSLNLKTTSTSYISLWTSENEVVPSPGDDVSLLVSGSVSSKDGSTRGTALFLGDVHVSGAITSDSTTFGQWSDGGTFIYPADESGAETVIVGASSIGAAHTVFASDGNIQFNKQNAGVDFRVRSENKGYMLHVTGGLDALTVARAAPAGEDALFSVSGSILSRGVTSDRGLSVFGGDTYVSGALLLKKLGTTPVQSNIGNANVGLYAKDDSGTTKLFYMDDAGSETLVGSGGGSGGEGDKNATFLVLSATGSLNAERVFTAGSGIETTDAGAGNSYTVAVDYAGADSFILAATDGTGITVDGDNDKLVLYDNDAAVVKYVNAGQVGTTYTAGDGLDLSGTEFSLDLKSSGGLVIDTTELAISNAIVATLTGSQFSGNVGITGSLGVTGIARLHGHVVLGNATGDDLTFNGYAASNFIPKTDDTYDLGSASKRWANVYTGDLHLRNDQGNWTIQEDADKLIVINNLTGKRYKMMLEPLEENE